MPADALGLAALLAVALALGFGSGFSFVVAPTLLRQLPRAAAGEALRALFPVYYLSMASASIAGMVCLAALSPARNFELALLAAVALTNIAQRRFLLPRIEAAREESPASPMRSPAFRKRHAASVLVNLLGLALLLAAFVNLGWT